MINKIKKEFKKTKIENNFVDYHIENTSKDFEDWIDWIWCKEHNVNPYELTRCSCKKVGIKCQEKDYHGTYEVSGDNFTKERRCSFCASKKVHPLDSFAQWGINEYGEDFLDKYWDYNKNTINPYEITPQSHKKVWIKCQEKNHHGSYEVNGNCFVGKKSRCPFCTSKKVHPLDSLGFLCYDISKMIINDERNKNKNGRRITFEDMYNISCKGGASKYFIKCNECGCRSDKKVRVEKIIRQGYSCRYCSDGFTIPNKMLYQIFKHYNIKCEYEVKEIINGNTYRRDGYDRENKIIIEMDGGYGNHAEEYDNQRDKDFLSIGEYTIRIDLTNDKKYKKNIFDYIKRQVLNSNLPIYLYYAHGVDFDNFDWNEAWKNCQKSRCIEAWNLWNDGLSVTKIADEINCSNVTIRRFLKRGKEIGLCDYTKEESKKRRGKLKSGVSHGNARLYRVIKKDGTEEIMCGNEIYNEYLNISYETFKKYILPYGEVNLNNYNSKESHQCYKIMEIFKEFNGVKIIPIDKSSK